MDTRREQSRSKHRNASSCSTAFFAPYDPQLFRLAALGRQELRSLAGRVDLALGDSEFNRQELEELGFGRTGVMPIVPNKRIEDHIRLAEVYKRYVDSYYRFIFVGRYDGVPRYFSMIQALVVQYQMLPERFVFTGGVPNEDLAAYYRWADAYVSLSEHEGFCVPLVESMAMDVPVLAYAAGAVPETLGGAGVLFSPKDLEFAAEMLGTLVYDRAVRDQVIAGQRRRLRDFSPARINGHLKEVLATLGA